MYILRWGKYKCQLDLSLNEVEWNDMFKHIAIIDVLEANSFSEKMKYFTCMLKKSEIPLLGFCFNN